MPVSMKASAKLLAGIIAVLAIGSNANAATIPLFNKTVPLGASPFSAQFTILWDTDKDRLTGRGRIKLGIEVYGQKFNGTIVQSESHITQSDGRVLRLEKEVKGASGLRIKVISQFTRGSGRTMDWNVTYKAYNVNAKKFGKNFNKTVTGGYRGKIVLSRTPPSPRKHATKLTGKSGSGTYAAGNRKIRFFAATFGGSFNKQNAGKAAARAAQLVRKHDITHKELAGNGNYLEKTLGSGQHFLVGYVDDESRRYGWLAQDRGGAWLTNSGRKGVNNDWIKLIWKSRYGFKVLLQVGNFRGKVQWQCHRH